MERFIADLVQGLDGGKIDRREFCKSVALAAAVYGAGRCRAGAGPTRASRSSASTTCPIRARITQGARLVRFGPQHEERGHAGRRQAVPNLTFGPEPGKGGSFLVARNIPASVASGSAGAKPGAEAAIDHICYTVANWDEARVRATLKAKGLDVTGRDGSPACLRPVRL